MHRTILSTSDLRLNYSSGTILDKEIEREENSKDECEDEGQEEVQVDVNNEIIETWMIYPSLVKYDQKFNKMIIVDFAFILRLESFEHKPQIEYSIVTIWRIMFCFRLDHLFKCQEIEN